MRPAILIYALVLSVSFASAEKHSHPGGKVEIDIPGTWKVEKRDSMLVGRSKDDAVGLVFWIVDSPNVDQAVAKLDKALAGKITDWKWPKKPQKTVLNGMKGIKNVGTAKANGKDAHVMVAVLGTPTKKGVIVVGVIDAAKVTEHKAELENIFASLKPMK